MNSITWLGTAGAGWHKSSVDEPYLQALSTRDQRSNGQASIAEPCSGALLEISDSGCGDAERMPMMLQLDAIAVGGFAELSGHPRLRPRKDSGATFLVYGLARRSTMTFIRDACPLVLRSFRAPRDHSMRLQSR